MKAKIVIELTREEAELLSEMVNFYFHQKVHGKTYVKGSTVEKVFDFIVNLRKEISKALGLQ